MMDRKGSPANILNVINETEQPDMYKREGAIGGREGREEGPLAEYKREGESGILQKTLKAFVRLKKRNRLNYYFVFIPFWVLYLKL